MKMRHYRLTESRIKRVIRHPVRTEEGILPRAIAAMSPAEGKKYSEIWVMYIFAASKASQENQKSEAQNPKQIKIITAWRYPGKSPSRDPIPAEILEEMRNLI